jgi:hypothetical protein
VALLYRVCDELPHDRRIWLAHHGIFRRFQYMNRELMVINLVLLMAVSFLPFPTKLMAEAIHDSDATRAAVIFHGGALLVTSILVGVLWASIARDRRVLKPEVSEKEINAIAVAATPNIGFYVVILAARAFRSASGRLRVSRDRDRWPAASTWRPHASTHDHVCLTPPCQPCAWSAASHVSEQKRPQVSHRASSSASRVAASAEHAKLSEWMAAHREGRDVIRSQV